ncbi:MAG: isoprenyl transferase [Clostridia bacterium]|nr:isoprenyl transferase [Clostridia bacterium]
MKKENQQELYIPEHVGIIMDGNGRWAKKRGLPRPVGHTYGAQTFRKITRYISSRGVKYLTLYAFSTENWKRPLEEVSAIMKIFRQYLMDALTDFRDDDIKVRFIGDTSAFDDNLKKLINETEEISEKRQGMVLNIAMNYGGRDEILRAVKQLCSEVKDNKLSYEDITEQDISSRLYTAGQPDPDLIIRTGAEHRLSNFLLYQAAYSEFYSMDVLWPDFKPDDFEKAILEFNKRSRRFGGV